MRTTLLPSRSREERESLERYLSPWREAGVFDGVELHVVDHLAALVGETNPDVLLGLALAVRAPLHGHICVDLKTIELTSLLPEFADATSVQNLALPADRDAWLKAIHASALTRAHGTNEPTPFVLDGSVLYSDRYYTYEIQLADALLSRAADLRQPVDPALLASGLQTLFTPPDDGTLDRQQLGAAMACLRGFTVISGGPGTGKTYTVRNILTLLWAQWATEHNPDDDVAGPRVALAAPTGKAAARMKEALLFGLDEFIENAAAALPPNRTVGQLRSFVTELQPSTIHRLLGWQPQSSTRFRHDAQNPLLHEIVVIDESSMVDFAMMAKLADAVAPQARLILLGDKHQLASVEAGTVLADICGPTSVESQTVSAPFALELATHADLDTTGVVAHTEERSLHDCIIQLDRSRRFRNDSGIGQFARACLADDFDADHVVDILTSGRFTDVKLLEHGPRSTVSQATAAVIVKGYRPCLERLLAGPRDGESREQHHAAVLTLFDSFRVLCAHRAGFLGVEGMNRTIVDLLTRERTRLAREQGRRSPLSGFAPDGEFWVGRPIIVRRNDYVVGRFNGDVGIVVRSEDGDSLVVAFPSDDGIDYLATARLPEHQTVFAMTIHKSQGSEFSDTLVVLPDKASQILTRELVYTGATRAKSQLLVVTDKQILADGLGARVARASGLKRRLWMEPERR